MAKIIQVSFKDDELDLYYKILTNSKLQGKSGWMKLAAFEKLERDSHNYSSASTIQPENELPITKDGLNSLLEAFI